MLDCKEIITVNGQKQTIHIKGNNENNPVLLFLHGGPGVPNRHSVIKNNDDLLDDFTIVAWDQRGVAGSYKNTDYSTLTVTQVVEDANEVVKYLCQRMNKKKIFIIGGSWGSLLGTKLSYAHPELLAGFVGFGQFVDGERNEAISYQFALDQAKANNDEKSVKLLEDLGAPVRGVYKGGFKGMMVQRNIMMKYGGYSQNAKEQSYWDSVVVPVFKSGEYSVSDLYGYIVGYKKVLTAMWDEVASVNLIKECPELKIPFFIFDGRLDNNTPAVLVEELYENIKAPVKELHWFEKSGHNPLQDEPELFKSLLKEKFLAIAKNENL